MTRKYKKYEAIAKHGWEPFGTGAWVCGGCRRTRYQETMPQDHYLQHIPGCECHYRAGTCLVWHGPCMDLATNISEAFEVLQDDQLKQWVLDDRDEWYGWID